ncbi:MAG: DUF6057 family protein, partial [Candidatus Latescibacterota bacterium]
MPGDLAGPQRRWWPGRPAACAAGTAALLAAYGLQVRFAIDPALIYQAQEPPFFTGTAFLRQHLGYPGGLAEYGAAALGQLLPDPWPGAVALTALAALACLPLWGLLWSLTGRSWPLLAAVPAVFALALRHDYGYPLGPE